MSASALIHVAAAGHQAPSADNTQPWRFEADGAGLNVRYDAGRVAGRTFPALDPGTLLSIGAVLENMLTALEQGGLSRDLAFGALASPGEPYFRLSFETGQSVPDDRKHPLWQRHTNRFRYHSRPLPAALVQSLGDMREEHAEISVLESPPLIGKVASLVAAAASIRFQTREVHEWLGASLRFTRAEVERGDGLDLQTIDLPPGGAIFLRLISNWGRMERLNRLGIHRVLARLDSAPVAQAPALVLITSGDDPCSLLAAGRLMVRAWNRLNGEDLAVQPYYVIPDMLERFRQGRVPTALMDAAGRLAMRVDEVLGTGLGKRARMLLRVGYPRTDPPRSRRVPLERVLAATQTP